MTSEGWFVSAATLMAGFCAGVVARCGAESYRQVSGQRARWQRIRTELQILIAESDPQHFLATYVRLLRQLCGWTLRQFATAVISLGPVVLVYFAASAIRPWNWKSELSFFVVVAVGSLFESCRSGGRDLTARTDGRPQ